MYPALCSLELQRKSKRQRQMYRGESILAGLRDHPPKQSFSLPHLSLQDQLLNLMETLHLDGTWDSPRQLEFLLLRGNSCGRSGRV